MGIIEFFIGVDSKKFGGAKSVILSTTSVFGGKNDFMPFLFYLIGAIFFAMSLMFIVQFKLSDRKVSSDGQRMF